MKLTCKSYCKMCKYGPSRGRINCAKKVKVLPLQDLFYTALYSRNSIKQVTVQVSLKSGLLYMCL